MPKTVIRAFVRRGDAKRAMAYADLPLVDGMSIEIVDAFLWAVKSSIPATDYVKFKQVSI